MKNDLIGKNGLESQIHEVNCTTFLKIIDIMSFSKEKFPNIILERSELYTCMSKYHLLTKKIDSYKCLTLSDLKESKKLIDESYLASNKRITIKATQTKIMRWINVIEAYIQYSNEKEESSLKINTIDFPLTVKNLIERNKQVISFQESYASYRNVYCLNDNEPGNLNDFIKYLNCNYLTIDKEEFFKSLYMLGIQS